MTDIVSSNSPLFNDDYTDAQASQIVQHLNELSRKAPERKPIVQYRTAIQPKPTPLCFKCGEHPRAPGKARCRECYGEWKKAYRKRIYNPEKQRDNNLRAHFNITQYDYDLMFFRQAGCCAICGKQETKIHPVTGKVHPLCVDHNHETGQVRQLLCYGCNSLLGRVEKDRGLIKKMEKYLKKHER